MELASNHEGRATALTREELLTLVYTPIEDDETPLAAFDLGTCSGRRDFLYRLAALGEAGLFAAVAHIWHSLAEPKQLRCTFMGKHAGTGGEGKTALVALLALFLDEMMVMPELPAPEQYSSMAEWHQAVMRCWSDEHDREAASVTRFAALLNGEAPC